MEVSLNDEQDFGEYKCVAYNCLDPLNATSVTVKQISMFQHIEKYIYNAIRIAGERSSFLSTIC